MYIHLRPPHGLSLSFTELSSRLALFVIVNTCSAAVLNQTHLIYTLVYRYAVVNRHSVAIDEHAAWRLRGAWLELSSFAERSPGLLLPVPFVVLAAEIISARQFSYDHIERG
jgi:hypothetical protein